MHDVVEGRAISDVLCSLRWSTGMKPPPLRIVVVGAGSMGRRHARLCAELGGAQLAAVVDPHGEAGRRLAATLGALWLASPDLVDPDAYDAAIICTPTASHLELATWFAGRGKHVLVEKPHRL